MQQILDLGTTPNDGTGTKLRQGGQAINENFTELYSKGGLVANAFFTVAASDAPTTIKNRADYICDGTNDEVEIEAALTLGNVQLTEGTFDIATTIDIPSNKTLQGSGKQTIVTSTTMTGTYEPAQITTNTMFLNSGGSNIIIKDLQIQGTTTAFGFHLTNVGSGTWITGVPGIKFENVYFNDFESTSIKLIDCHNCIITGCEFLNCNQDAITLTRTSGELRTSHVLIKGNQFHGSLAAIFISYAQDIHIIGNQFTGQSEYHMQFDYPRRVVVDGNHCRYTNTIDGISANGEASSTDLVIINNYIEGSFQNGIFSAFVQHTTIANNVVVNCGEEGIWLEDSGGCSIHGNNVSDCGTSLDNTYSGILALNLHGGKITNNTVRRGIAANRHSYGLEVYGSASDYTLIADNDLYISGVTGGFLRGSSSGAFRIRNNIDNDGSWMGDAFFYTNDLTPAQITADQNNYNPSELIDAAVLRLDTDASRTLTGLAGGTDGRCMIIHNIGSNNLVFSEENASSTAANRFQFGVTLASDESLFMRYDGVTTRWRLISTTVDGSGLQNVVEDLTPQSGGVYDTNSFMLQLSKGADVASAGALPILQDGNSFNVTGTTTITSINTTGKAGTVIKLRFDDVLTLTHHATDLILPTGANIVTQAGDEAEFLEYAAGDFRCTGYLRADGTALAGSGTAPIPTTYTDLAALIAGQGSQILNYVYEVTDGSGFTGITSGIVWAKYLGTTVGTEADYTWEPRPSGGSSTTDKTGTTFVFTGDAFYNRVTPLTSGNIILDPAGAVAGTVLTAYFNGYIPLFLCKTKDVSIDVNDYNGTGDGLASIMYNGSDISIMITDRVMEEILTINLVASYAFESDVSDYTGNNDGVDTDITFVLGKVGNQASFNGATGGIVVPDSNDFSFTDGSDVPFLVTSWITFDSFTGLVYFMEKRDSGTNFEYIFNRNGNTLQMILYTAPSNFIQVTTSLSGLSSGVAYHFAFLYTGSGNKDGLFIYRNAVDVSDTKSLTGTYTGMSNKATDIYIGRRHDGTGVFNGDFDEFHVWKDRLFTISEIEKIYEFENDGNSILP
jgi:parallel beta-helix repeat protein